MNSVMVTEAKFANVMLEALTVRLETVRLPPFDRSTVLPSVNSRPPVNPRLAPTWPMITDAPAVVTALEDSNVAPDCTVICPALVRVMVLLDVHMPPASTERAVWISAGTAKCTLVWKLTVEPCRRRVCKPPCHEEGVN